MEEDLRFPFDRDGFRHVLVRRVGDICLVERMNLRVRPPSVHWEVVLLQHQPAQTLPSGKRYPARESYPSTEQWGEAGWTYTDPARADARMAELAEAFRDTATQASPLRVGHEGGPSGSPAPLADPSGKHVSSLTP